MMARGSGSSENTTRDSGIVPVKSQQELDNERTESFLDPNSPSYYGPGYELKISDNGTKSIGLSQDPMRQIAQNEWSHNRGKEEGRQEVVSTTPPANTTPNPNRDLNPFAGSSPIVMPGTAGTQLTNSIAPRATTSNVRPGPGFQVNSKALSNLGRVTTDPNANAPGAQAPKVDTTKIDPLLDNLNKYSGILDQMIAADNSTDLSAAEAQLLSSQKMAAQRASVDLEANQRGAIGQARAARNRGDRGLLERSAIGESAFLGQEKARTDALQQTEYEGNLATLRANEEQEDKKFKADLIKQATDLGLNTAGAQIDISKADLGSVNNWINNEFEQLGMNKQLDQRQTEALLNYTHDMSLLQYQYDKMDSDEQIALSDQIMKKYGVDKEFELGLEKIRSEGGFNWTDLAMNMVSGFSQGAGGAAGKAAFSDERVKIDIEKSSFEDPIFESLMKSASPYTFEYDADQVPEDTVASGKNFGLMAQNLEKSVIGKSFVRPNKDGIKMVDGARSGLAALAGLSVIFDKVKELEDKINGSN